VQFLGYEGGNTLIAHEIGGYYLFVRGDCRFWVSIGGPYEWQLTRTGTLTLDQERWLSTEMQYDRWPEVAGSYRHKYDKLAQLVLSDGKATIHCEGNCMPPGAEVPPGFDGIHDTLQVLLADVWELGVEPGPEEPMRIDLVRLEDDISVWGDDPCVAAWRFGWDPAARAKDPLMPHPSQLIEDPQLAEELRAFRAELQQGILPMGCAYNPYDGGPAQFTEMAPMTLYWLWMRDSMPWEGEEPGVPVPAPPGGW
jgi:hypothetical protein